MSDQPPIKSVESMHTIQGGVSVPFLRSIAAGFIFSLPIMVICGALAVNWEPFRPWWFWVWVLFLTVFMAFWWGWDEHFRVRIINIWEKITGRDIDGDGDVNDVPIPDPEIKEIRGTTEWTNEHGQVQGAMDRIVINETLAAEFARGVLVKGLSTAERNWKGSGKPFGDEDWDNWIGHLLRLNAIRERSDKNFRLGYEITKVGVSYLNGFLSEDEQWKILDKYWNLRAE